MGNADERRSDRAKVLLTAAIESGASRLPVRVANLSTHGALVIGDGLPAGGTRIIFRCNEAVIGGWVAWNGAGRAGIQFDDPVEPEKLAQRAAVRPATIIKDTREIDFRRPGFRGNQLTDEERKIVEAWTQKESKSPGDEGL